MIKRIYCDIETTGKDPKRNGIIQAAFIRTIDNVKEGQLTIEMQPFMKDELDEEAMQVNGVHPSELFSNRRVLPLYAHNQIVDFLKEKCDQYDKFDKYFFIGFRAGFDCDFMREFFAKCEDKYFGSFFWTPPCDVMMLAAHFMQRVRPKMPNFKLTTVWEWLHQVRMGDGSHDALFDIDRTMEIEAYLRMVAIGQKKVPETCNVNFTSL